MAAGKTVNPILIEHHADQDDSRQKILTKSGQGDRNSRAHGRNITGKAGDQFAGIRTVEETNVEPDDMFVKLVLDISKNTTTYIAHQHGLAVVGKALQGKCEQNSHADRDQHCTVLFDKYLVDDRIHQIGIGTSRSRHKCHANQSENNLAEVRLYRILHDTFDQGPSAPVFSSVVHRILRQ